MNFLTAISNAIVSVCNVVCTTAGAAERGAKAIDNLAAVAEHSSAIYKDEAYSKMAIRKVELDDEYQKALAKLPDELRAQVQQANESITTVQ